MHQILEKTKNKSLTTLPLTKEGPEIPILCFADDCLVFGKADTKTMETIAETLEEYALACGQNVCWKKSRIIFSANMPVRKKHKITDYLGVIPNQRLDKYLGLPFLLGQKNRDLFDQIINRTMNKINISYTRYLSYAGLLVSIKAVTNAIPAYAMSIARIPTTCLNQLENISRKFLWNGKKDGKQKEK